MNFIKKSQNFDSFNQFYDLMINVHQLNEDLWFLIYNKSQSKFKKNDICKWKIFQDKYCEIKIYDIYFHNKFNKYVYSFHYFNSVINGISFYASENDLEIYKN